MILDELSLFERAVLLQAVLIALGAAAYWIGSKKGREQLLKDVFFALLIGDLAWLALRSTPYFDDKRGIVIFIIASGAASGVQVFKILTSSTTEFLPVFIKKLWNKLTGMLNGNGKPPNNNEPKTPKNGPI